MHLHKVQEIGGVFVQNHAILITEGSYRPREHFYTILVLFEEFSRELKRLDGCAIGLSEMSELGAGW